MRSKFLPLSAVLLGAALFTVIGVQPASAAASVNEEPLTLAQVEADTTIVQVAPEPDLIKPSGHNLTLDAAAAAALDPNRITCSYTGGIVKTYDWSNKNPTSCGGHYRVYSNGSLVFQHLSSNGPGIWGVINQGHRAVENWCGANPFACSVISAVGTAIVFKKLKLN